MRSRLARWGWYPIVLLALLFAAIASRYLSLDPAVYFPVQREVYRANEPWLLLHVCGALVALALGPFQFRAAIRNRRPGVHRAMGRAYLIAVLAGGIGGASLARLAYGGFPARVGFALLAAAWLTTGALAYRRIRAGEVDRHREWMLRSMALTFAAVTLRLWLPLLSGALGVPFDEAYVTVAWLCWVPNLIVAEWWIQTTRPTRPRRALPESAAAAAAP